ncbi:unnamed protein product [marine sediment metagenome]|uniref:Polysaccharide pyruvyl transferase domain-containing protein n=1 Tax=marine sediment metagenome TaxID=412755 RepID=X1J9R2_9ZZZZ
MGDPKEKKVVYVYRKDLNRSWGLFWEKRRISKLFKKVKGKYPNKFKFYVIGDLDSYRFPSYVNDRRVHDYSKKTEIEWVKILNKAETVIGVHGSHMMMPGLLAEKVIDLLPYFKYGHIGEDIFFERRNMNNLIKDIQFVRGNNFLTDLNVSKVFKIFEYQYEASKRQHLFSKMSEAIYKDKNDKFYVLIKNRKQSIVDPGTKLDSTLIKFYKIIKNRRGPLA